MGRRKRKQLKPWCWYCNRDFEDEKILIHHQKAKHFKCPFCHRKLYTGPGLSIHCNAVHKEKLDKIPNALPNRSSTVIDIYGMSGIPEADILEHERQKFGLEGEDEPPEKMEKLDDEAPSSSMYLPPPVPLPFMQPVPGMLSYMPMQCPIPGGIPQFMSPAMIPAPPPPPPPPPPQVVEPPQPPPEEPPKPTFPAYSDFEVSKGPVQKIIRPSTGANGVAIDLVYPDEDLALEELKSNLPKYKDMVAAALRPPLPVVPQPPGPTQSMLPGIMPASVPGVQPPAPYGHLPPGLAQTVPQMPFMPLQQPVYAMPGYPQPVSQVPPWAGLPNVRF